MTERSTLSVGQEKIFIDTVGCYSTLSDRPGHRRKCLAGYIEALDNYPVSSPLGWNRQQVKELKQYAKDIYMKEFIFPLKGK